jgi:2-oxoglutarate ferredoxin oxidoreductase subunit alpha
MKTGEEVNIVIGGEAGQGLVTIGELLCKTIVAAGYEIVVTKSYQSRIRGGHNTFNIRIAAEPIHSPSTWIDLLIALNKETVAIHEDEMTESGVTVVDKKWEIEGNKHVAVPYEELGEKRVINVIALGVIGSLLKLDCNNLKHLIEKNLGKKKPELLDENLEALTKSYQWTDKHSHSVGKPLPPVESKEPRMLITGNEAIALGAMAAGMKFGAFYPMTPATSIMLTIISYMDAMGIIVEQAEDEIAAINMALGASFAGAPAMVATSGGGFALMTEAVSLAGMTETPIVVAVAQRPGPATGLPTRTEQGDLEFILHAGHGEFPRILLTPDSVESCFHLAHWAFFLAEEFQIPCFILTDQFLADSSRAVTPFKVSDMKTVQSGHSPESLKGEYQRYAINKSGISPRLLPGRSLHLVVADSDEHNSDGHITEDLAIRVDMVNKRLRKQKKILNSFIPPTYVGDADAELLLICWGSSSGAVIEAAQRIQEQERPAAALCFSQVWPLDPSHFLSRLEKTKEVICVEGNATGQFARLIRRETGFMVDGNVLRYDGLPLTADYIIEKLLNREVNHG